MARRHLQPPEFPGSAARGTQPCSAASEPERGFAARRSERSRELVGNRERAFEPQPLPGEERAELFARVAAEDSA